MKNTNEILADVKKYLNQHFYFERQGDAEICSLYAMFTYVSDRCNATPFLMINGKPGTGKSRLAGNLIAICKSPFIVDQRDSAIFYIQKVFDLHDKGEISTFLVEEVDCYENSPIFIEMRAPKIFVAVHPQYFLSNWCVTVNLKNVSFQQLANHNISTSQLPKHEEIAAIVDEIDKWSKRFIWKDFWLEVYDPKIYFIEVMKKFGYIPKLIEN